MSPSHQPCASIGSFKINQWCRLYEHSQVAENNLEAYERGLGKRKGDSCLYIHLHHRSVVYNTPKLWSIINVCLSQLVRFFGRIHPCICALI